MDKLNKITGQLANKAAIVTALHHLDRMLGGQDQTLEHLLSCYRQMPKGRPIEIVSFDIQHNRIDAILAISEEMKGTVYSWDRLSELAFKQKAERARNESRRRREEELYDIYDGIDINSIHKAYMKAREYHRQQEERRKNQRVINLQTLENVHDVLAIVKISEERKTRKGDVFLVVRLQANENSDYKIEGYAYVFDQTTVNAIKASTGYHGLRITPSLDPDYPPRLRKIL